LSEDKISRRKYLKYAGAAVGIGAIAAAGYGISQYYQAPTPTKKYYPNEIYSIKIIKK